MNASAPAARIRCDERQHAAKNKQRQLYIMQHAMQRDARRAVVEERFAFDEQRQKCIIYENRGGKSNQ